METDNVMTYDSEKNNPLYLSSLIGKYVTVQLIQEVSVVGFVRAIDPEGYSFILSEPCGDSFKTVLIPGHAIVDVTVRDDMPNITPVPASSNATSTENNLERKSSLISWFTQNHLPVIENEDKIEIGNAVILPPYNVTSIYSTNLTVVKQIKDIMEKMPSDSEKT